jgi:hypothetical protein
MQVQDEKTKAIDGAVSRRKVLLNGTALAAATAMGSAGPIQMAQAQQQRTASMSTALPSDQIGEVAVSAYLYAYPLISMEMARRISTNVADVRQFAKAPMNQFANVPAFPDATYTDIVRPNADTLYSLLWFDVSKEPLLISVPDSGGRYYLLPMYDMWTDAATLLGIAISSHSILTARSTFTSSASHPAKTKSRIGCRRPPAAPSR